MSVPAKSVKLYQRAAPSYDASRAVRISRRAQARAVTELGLRPGWRVLDVACGTGLNFEAIEEGIGPLGALVGLDSSPDMLERARRRIDAKRWENVSLQETAAVDAQLEGLFDAALFSFSHDVLRSREAIEHLLPYLRTGARIAAAGVMYPSGLLKPLRPLMRAAAAPYATSSEGLERPWSHLDELVGTPWVERLMGGCMFVVSGQVGAHP